MPTGIRNHFLVKGERVRARWFKPSKLGSYSLAGNQLKFSGGFEEVVGTVTHIRGNHPTNPTTIRVWIKPDVGDEIAVDVEHIVEVLGKEKENA